MVFYSMGPLETIFADFQRICAEIQKSSYINHILHANDGSTQVMVIFIIIIYKHSILFS